MVPGPENNHARPYHVNRQRVRDRLACLDDEYGVEYREDERVEVEPERFPAEIRLSREGYDGSSYVWIVRPPEAAGPLTESMPDDAGNDRPRVLMILGRGGDEWGIPGGGREGDETFEEGHIAIQPGELDGAAWLSRRPRDVHPIARPVAQKWFAD